MILIGGVEKDGHVERVDRCRSGSSSNSMGEQSESLRDGSMMHEMTRVWNIRGKKNEGD